MIHHAKSCNKYPIQALKKGKVCFLSANFYGKVYFVFLKVRFTIRYEFI